MNMEYRRLTDCAYYRNERTKQIDYETYITTDNMLPNRAGITETESLPDAKTVSKYLPGDILLSNIRPYFKKIWFSNREGGCSNDVLVVASKPSVIPRFLYYVLSDDNFFNYDNVTSKGTKMPRGTPNAIMKYLFPKLEKDTQARIVSILSAYDNLVEVNNKRIMVLEQMAENLYKEWFVRFRFPGHEAAVFENGMPKGWERARISKYYITSSGGTPSRETEEHYENGTIPWIKTGEMQDCLLIETEEKITEEAVKKSSAKLFPKDSVLMAMYGVNIGKLAYSTMDATCNQACCVFKDRMGINTKHYLFHCLMSIRDYLLLISFGAAQQNLSQDLIKRIRILRPDDATLTAFERAIEPLYIERKHLLGLNSKLIKQRDLLLPRLMSGRLEV